MAGMQLTAARFSALGQWQEWPSSTQSVLVLYDRSALKAAAESSR